MAQNVVVEEITQEAGKLLTTSSPQFVDLDHPVLEQLVDRMIQRLREQGRVFLITWEGDDTVPRGVQVGDLVITGTQHGCVMGSLFINLPSGVNLEDWFQQGRANRISRRIGTYDCLEEYGGESGNRHKMLIYLRPSASRVTAARP